MGKIWVVGLGPGGSEHMTAAAKKAIGACDVLCGYTAYVDLVREMFPEKECLTTGMTREIERCTRAVEAAAEGKNVAMVCSGDAGVYGMAGPVLQLAEGRGVEVEVVPGVTAALSGAAVLGAPLMNDFCVISLSDHLTPWETIVKRLRGAAEGGFAIVLYNPCSRQRPEHLRRACEILLGLRSGDTVCGWVRQIGREGQTHRILTLKELADEPIDMFTTVFIGGPETVMTGGRMVTPRGYEAKEK